MNVDKAKGAFFGLIVGDALGVPLEFKERDRFPAITGMIEPGQNNETKRGAFDLRPGEWTDDTSLALALTDCLINHGMNEYELLTNFVSWYKDGRFSHNHKAFDIGNTTRDALHNFMVDGRLTADSSKFRSGNGGIMRLAPAAIYANSKSEAGEFCTRQSKTTHASNECIVYSNIMAGLIWSLIHEPDLKKSTLHNLIEPDIPRAEVKSSGYVQDTYKAAIWSITNTTTFKDALLLAVNLADDADTVGAVTGQIAGAIYGFEEIPEEWIQQLAWKDELHKIFTDLIKAKNAKKEVYI